MGAIIEGISWGLLLSVLAGPIFFTIMQTGIERGAKPAIALAAGQWLSDTSYILLVFLGSSYIGQMIHDEALREQFIFYMGTAGAVLLTAMGISLFFTKPPLPDAAESAKERSLMRLFVQGWVINTINPTPIFFWMTLMGSAMMGGYSPTETILLFISVMGTVIVTDVLKVYAAKRIRRWLRPQYLIYIRRAAGIALLLFSSLLIIRIYF